ncbi:two-component system chemotaxis response regulator CheB [Sagittula marina]|uniref:Protein-glutamate methylesterase/protein-glutamine glutaminase n=1 Tax=Sagittula marina TaxID=943940 RepID=A0A7W6DSF4_9RHOB|nr:chemotaxis response regulator protein-glutamate methylesterase [Sagittula marina]MBB3985830.1 two-component system chemotaxis response regulator CheB [Sagittula marina]
MPNRQINVLVVDDSATVRSAFSAIIRADAGLSLFATASDPFIAVERMKKGLPDVILLDLELPNMDGLTFLKKIMSQRPMPVVVCSSYTEAGSQGALKALDLGAAEVLAKPRLDTQVARAEAAVQIGDALRAAVSSRHGDATRRPAPAFVPGEKYSADVVLPHRPPKPVPETMPIVAIGASTGGTEALRDVLTALPAEAPAIAVVQHMPEKFTHAFANRLNTLCRIEVREAENGDVMTRGTALIAPGNHHMILRRSGTSYRVDVVNGPYVSRHRPSVDVLFRSVAQAAGANALGIIMTGMGDDGAAGMAEMHASGARTVAQDEASSVVWGMPREAIDAGGVDKVVALQRIAKEIDSHAQLAVKPGRVAR